MRRSLATHRSRPCNGLCRNRQKTRAGRQSSVSPPRVPALAETIHLNPTAPLAERVLLPGDPGRALRLAQLLLSEPKMFNHNRGLWGYTGEALTDGGPLSVQSTGMGGPSAAIVIHELVELGARRLVRVGTCAALSESLTLGDLVVATEALAADGTSRALGAGERVAAPSELLASLTDAAAPAEAGAVVSTDVFYDGRETLEQSWRDAGALAVEMETATLFTLAAKLGVQAGSLLLVSDLLRPQRTRIDAGELHDGEARLGTIAAHALAADAPAADAPAADARAGDPPAGES
jgi:DeoD family purine-nucleoside phosphorylase